MTEPEQPPLIPQYRETFDQETIGRSRVFAQELLQLVPELDGVAVVASYALPNPALPYAFVTGRNGALSQPGELMHMAVQMHGCLQLLLQNSLGTIKQVDAMMGERSRELIATQNELRNLQQQIDDKRRELADLGG